jgi:hypothetical protein
VGGHLIISLKLKKIINKHVGLLVCLEFFLRHTYFPSGVNQLRSIYLKLLLVYLLQRSSVSLTYVILLLSSMLIKSVIIDGPGWCEFNSRHMCGFLVAVECVTLQTLIKHALINQWHAGISEFIHEFRLPAPFLPGGQPQWPLLRHLLVVLLDVVGHLTLLVHHQIVVHFLVVRGYTAICCGGW